MHSVICNVMLKYTFTKKIHSLHTVNFRLVHIYRMQYSIVQSHLVSQPTLLNVIDQFSFLDRWQWVAAQSREWAWNEIASYSVHKKTWLSEGVQTACGIHFAAEVE